MKSPLLVNLTLLLIAFIWGFGFVPQREGMNFFAPATFNAYRFAIGALTLLPLLWLNSNVNAKTVFKRNTLLFGLAIGFLLFAGATFQQIGIQYTSLANVAFISGLYVIIVPVLGFFVGYRYTRVVWFGGTLAIAGLYLMTGSGDEVALRGDMLILISAFFFAIHLLVLAGNGGRHNKLALAFLQFLICAAFSLAYALSIQNELLPSAPAGYLWALFNGVVVVAVAYTLQVVVMDYAEPFAAAVVLSLEAVFGAIAGYLVYSEQLAAAALVGAGMILLGCVLAQLPGSQRSQSA